MSNILPDERSAHAFIYVVADIAYSHTGLEGILGFNPARAFLALEAAKAWGTDTLKQRHQNKEGVECEWRLAHKDDGALLILSYSYLEAKHIPAYNGMTDSGIAVHMDAKIGMVRNQPRDDCAILDVPISFYEYRSIQS